MRYSQNFDPEWGYLAPAPSFIRTARLVLAATAVGAIAGAGVVFSLASHPSSENSIASRTLAKPAELSTDMRAGRQAEVTSTSSQAAAQVAARFAPQKLGHLTDEAALNPHINSIAQAHAERDSVRSVASPGNAEVTVVVPLVEATETPAPNIQRVQKKATKKSGVTSRYAWREPGRWGGEYYRDHGWHYGDTW
jgi:hypothetical protein